MRRRTFLAAAAAAAAGAGSYGLTRRYRWWRVGEELHRLEGFGSPLVDRLRAHFDWVTFDPEAFGKYVTDYQRHFGPFNRFGIPDGQFYTRFLLSTDFFEQGVERPRDVRPVRYVTYYEAGEAPCYNPLAQPPPSDAELAAKRSLPGPR